MMNFEPVTCILMFVSAMNFELIEMAKKLSLGLFRPNLPQLGLFDAYFVCKNSFRVISMIKMLILDQFINPKFINCTFIIHTSGI